MSTKSASDDELREVFIGIRYWPVPRPYCICRDRKGDILNFPLRNHGPVMRAVKNRMREAVNGLGAIAGGDLNRLQQHKLREVLDAEIDISDVIQ